MNTNINRKNYEEWLLLYVDNELSAAERTAVDAFVAQNPDVAAELALLQDTQLTNLQEPTLSFGDISHLLKSETAAISAEESTLLSYLDNELDAEATKAFEQALQQQPTLAATFALYQQTKLTPEHIACPKNAESYISVGGNMRPQL
jgi:anti-sigma factor RsiW